MSLLLKFINSKIFLINIIWQAFEHIDLYFNLNKVNQLQIIKQWNIPNIQIRSCGLPLLLFCPNSWSKLMFFELFYEMFPSKRLNFWFSEDFPLLPSKSKPKISSLFKFEEGPFFCWPGPIIALFTSLFFYFLEFSIIYFIDDFLFG